MKRLAALVSLCVVFSALAVPPTSINCDIQYPLRQFTLRAAAGTDPLIRALILNNGTNYDVTGWTGTLFYAASQDGTQVVAIGSTAAESNFVDFQIPAGKIAAPGTFFAQLIISDNTNAVEWSRGSFTIAPSPGTSGAMQTNWGPVFNWDAVVSHQGTTPWNALSNAMQSLQSDMTGASNIAKQAAELSTSAYSYSTQALQIAQAAATGTPLYAFSELDPVYAAEKAGLATGTPLYAFTELDPVYAAEKGRYATGTPLYAFSETDPVYAAEKGRYATGTPLYAFSETDPVYAAEKAGLATGMPLYAFTELDPIWSAVSNDIAQQIDSAKPKDIVERSNDVQLVGGSVLIGTDLYFRVYLMTNDTTFSVQELSTNTSSGELKAYIWPTNHAVSFDASVSTSGLHAITFSNDRPSLIVFRRPPFATNWYAFQESIFGESIMAGFPEAGGGGGGGGTLASGLVFYATFEDTAADLTGTQTLLGSNNVSYYSSGKIGKALALTNNGSGCGYIVYTNSTTPSLAFMSPSNSTGCSISFWANPYSGRPGGGDLYSVLMANLEGDWVPGETTQEFTGSPFFMVLYWISGLDLSVGPNVDWVTAYAGTTANAWQHVCITFDSSTLEIKTYVNGSVENTRTLTSAWEKPDGSGSFVIGQFPGRYNDTDRSFYGLIDEFAGWNRVLTSGEVTDLYNGGSGTTISL